MTYQIYIPGEHQNAIEAFDRVGLGALVDAKNGAMGLRITGGPDGSHGMLFFWEPRPKAHGYCPQEQEWTAAKPLKNLAGGRFWMGRDRGMAIFPESIQRKEMLLGYDVELGDGQLYKIPSSRRMPSRFTFDESGEPCRVPQSRYEAHYERTQQMYSFLLNNRIVPGLTIPGGVSFACDAINLNYRLTPELIDWLGLLTDESVVATIGATFEISVLREIENQKKKG